jgi:hypothetical protein
MKQTNEQRWQYIITAWERSGMAQRKFCTSKRVAFSTFQYWKKRLKKKYEQPRFIQVTASKKSQQHEISISFETGIRMIIPNTITGETLSRLILAVNEAICE